MAAKLNDKALAKALRDTQTSARKNKESHQQLSSQTELSKGMPDRTQLM